MSVARAAGKDKGHRPASLQPSIQDGSYGRYWMLFELGATLPHARAGGMLGCDGIFQRTNDALSAFARPIGRTFSTFSKLGFVRK